jgi:Zn-dependent metalloprotease
MLRSLRFAYPLFLLVTGCQPAADPAAPATPTDPLMQLEADTGHSWTVRWHKDIHTPAFMEGRTSPLAATPTDAQRAGRAFVKKYGSLFQLDGPDDEVLPVGAETDELGMTHARFAQRKGHLPVWGGELLAHFDTDGALIRLNGRLHPIAAVPDPAQLDADQARVAATLDARTLRPGIDPSEFATRAPEQVLYPVAPDRVKLAWRVEVSVQDPAGPLELESFVDASDGTILHHDDQIDSVDASGVGVFGDHQTLDVTEKRGSYWLEDGQRGGLKTYSARDKTRLPGSEVHSKDPNDWDSDGAASGAAVDAHAYAGLAWDYFANVHGRAGWKGDSVGPHVTVHYGDRFANAFFNGRQLVFGDGDGQTLAPLAGALDVVAHEYTHGVTAATAKLGHEGESGALNEAVSDVFGCLVAAANGGTRWQMGATVYHPRGKSKPIRDLAHPHASGNPQNLSEYRDTQDDQGGVHLNSTIASHAAYLMSQGGSGVHAIGTGDTGKIWYRALTRYLTSQSGFADAADATRSAASDLKVGVDATRDAWVAVGVTSEQ